MNNYLPFSTFVYRSPLNSYNKLIDLFEGKTNIETILKDELFKEAIYLSSTTLHDIIYVENKLSQKAMASLFKYYIRFSTRCTPFGLFAGCGIGLVSDETQLDINNRQIQRSTRLDMDFLNELSIEIQKKFRKSLRFSSNSTGYLIGGQYRYIEYNYEEGIRKHQLSAILLNDLLENILDFVKTPKTINEIADAIKEPFPKNQKIKYVESLIENQILSSNIEPFTVGMVFSNFLLLQNKQLTNKKRPDESVSILQKIINQIEEIDKCNLPGNIANYSSIKDEIKKLGINFNANYLLQSDVYFKGDQPKIAEDLVKKIKQGIDILSRFSKSKSKLLEDFKIAFAERYESGFVPLTEVLDEELGIGFPAKTEFGVSEASTLIKAFNYSPNRQKESMPIGDNDAFWLEKYEIAIHEKAIEIELKKDDWKDKPSKQNFTSPTISVLFSSVNIEGKSQIILKGIGSTTALNLIGRFCHGNESINRLALEIAQKEKDYYKEVIIAEIAHIPEKRVGNILMRPHFFDYEITYLSNSILPNDNQIKIDDLMVGVVDDEIILYSKKLKKRIIPRLSNAHNYIENSLPVYNFLCSIQHQGLAALSLDLGDVYKNLIFTPRIRYQDIVFKLASWKFQKSHTESIKNFVAFEQFIKYWNLPKYVTIADGDNELVIDTASQIGYDLFTEYSSKNKELLLYEWLEFEMDNPQNNRYTNQIILPLFKNSEEIPIKSDFNINPAIQRNFEPFSEWLYIKLYCGSTVSDSWLANLFQLILNYTNEKYIDKWFFVRYNDPHNHIRLRLKVIDQSKRSEITNQIQTISDNQNLPKWKLQYDTYVRELERYGPENIEIAETLFHIDSNNFAKILLNTDLLNDQNRWLACIINIDFYLKCFFPEIESRLKAIEKYKDSFAREFSDDDNIKQKFSDLFRNNRERIELYLLKNIKDNNYLKMDKILNKNKADIIRNISKLNVNERVTRIDLAFSCLHMHANRWHLSNQRLHEYFVYEVLFKTYRTIIAQMKLEKMITV